MQVTINQALTQAVTAHKEGNLKEAEHIYRAILQSQPAHAEANHNLGLLAVSVNKTEYSLKYFKAALEADSKIEQYWLSYIDALLKLRRFENAKLIVEKARRVGVTGEKLNNIEKHLSLSVQPNEPKPVVQAKRPSFQQRGGGKPLGKKKARKQNSRANNPSQGKIDNLLDHYQKGRFNDAETLARSIIERFPQHPFAWKVLGAMFKATSRKDEALEAHKTAVTLSPLDAEAHSNLGLMLKDLGRLAEAEACYTRAIALNDNYSFAHNNLGNVVRELGRLDEAEASYAKAILLQPAYTEAHNNLGIALYELGRFDEALISYKQAIALKPGYVNAHYNLGVVLHELDKLLDAEASYNRAIALKPNYAKAHSSLGKILKELVRLEEAVASFRQAICFNPRDLKAHDELLTCLYLLDKKSAFFDELDQSIVQNRVSATIGSLTCRSALRYGIAKPNLFCKEPLEYVSHTDLSPKYDFKEIFIEKAKTILNEELFNKRRQTLLVKGDQTFGNIFDLKNDFVVEMEKIIRCEVEEYRRNFRNKDEGLIKNWPNDYALYGWLISLNSGGKLRPHIHEQGWLSGSIYINIPRNLKADSGKLVVSLGEENDAAAIRPNIKKVINVVTGSMVLFPASLMHHTIPFESEEKRIVLAFDVNPK